MPSDIRRAEVVPTQLTLTVFVCSPRCHREKLTIFPNNGRRAHTRLTRKGGIVLLSSTKPAKNPAKLNRVSLRFANRNFEERFLRAHVIDSLPVIRLAILFGALIYALFGVLDALIFSESLYLIWAIRYAIGMPIIFGALLLTYSHYFVRFAQPLLALSMLASGVSILAMTAVAPAPGNGLYYAGLIIVVIYYSSVMRLHFTHSLFISIVLSICYQFVAIFVNPIPLNILLNNNFFLLFAVMTSALTNYAHEYYLRTAYINTRLMLREKAKSEGLLRKADSANTAKTQFLANMSHELRTPLNAILGFSEIMRHEMFGPLGSDRYRDYATDIQSSGNHLLNIIGDILDLARAETGKLRLSEEEVDLCDLAEDCLRMFSTLDSANGVRFSFKFPSVRTRVIADPRLMRQVLINLLSNAAKFSQHGGIVTISMTTDDANDYLIRIEDTGIGMEPDELRRAMEPFFQVESAFTRERIGAGLGLPLVLKIMELHGGGLELESEAGLGTTATARLPAERVLDQSQQYLPLRFGS